MPAINRYPGSPTAHPETAAPGRREENVTLVRLTIPLDGDRMVSRRKVRGMAETDRNERPSSAVLELGQIDPLVNQGSTGTGSDFIRTAIQRQPETRAATVDDTVNPSDPTLGPQTSAARSSATSGRQAQSRPR